MHADHGARRRGASATTSWWLSAWVIAAVLASGCGLVNPNTEEHLSGLLRDYIIAQEMYYAQHRRYAPSVDSLARGLAVPPWMQVQVHRSNAGGHSAHAWSPRDPDLVCVVFAGPLPSGLDRGFPGEPMCGTRAQFASFMSNWQPLIRDAEWGRQGPGVPFIVIVVLMVLVLAATYGFGVVLDRASRRFPPIWKVVFWTPAALVTVFVGLSAGLGTILRGMGRYSWGLAVMGLGIGAALNLGLFSVPHALRRPRSGDWWAALGLLAAAAAVYGAFAKLVAGDLVAGGARGVGSNADTVKLAVATAALSLLNLMGILQLIRARRRTKPVARTTASDAGGGTDIGPAARTTSTTTQTRRRVLLLVALAAAVLYLVTDRIGRSGEDAEPDPVSTFLESYVLLQEAYFADHGRYAGEADRGAIPVPVGVTLRIISSSATAYSVIAFSDSARQLCAVWVGEPPPKLDHDRPGQPVCDAPPRFEPWLAAVRRPVPVARVARIDTVVSAEPDTFRRAEPEAGQDVSYERIFEGRDWRSGQAFRNWATVVPLRNELKEPCSIDQKSRLAGSIDDVLFCERVATVGDDTELGGGEFVWSIVRSTAVPRYDCSVGITYLQENVMVRRASAADCDYALAIEDPSDNPIVMFRLRGTGEIGLVVDSHGAECASRHALLASGDVFERVHRFFLECVR